MREDVKIGFYPIICSSLTARGAESGFAGMRNFYASFTFRTDIIVVSKKTCSTDKEFQDIDDNTYPDQMMVFKKKFPPVAIV